MKRDFGLRIADLEIGIWDLEIGNWKLEFGIWKNLETGIWNLEIRNWNWEIGIWSSDFAKVVEYGTGMMYQDLNNTLVNIFRLGRVVYPRPVGLHTRRWYCTSVKRISFMQSTRRV
jgi:hypothetical protein